MPALLAVAGLHQHLIHWGTRSRVSLLNRVGRTAQVHHFACPDRLRRGRRQPYLAFEDYPRSDRSPAGVGITSPEAAVGKYLKAIVKGSSKAISKMGISTVPELPRAPKSSERWVWAAASSTIYFTGTPTRIEADQDVIAAEAQQRHGWPSRRAGQQPHAGRVGRYQYRGAANFICSIPPRFTHCNTPCNGDYAAYQRYVAEVHDRENQLATLRAILELNVMDAPLPVGESRAGGGDHGPLQDRGHVLQLDQPGGPRNAGGYHESGGRQNNTGEVAKIPTATSPSIATSTATAPSNRSPAAASASPVNI